ncbi:MAG TPA: glycosyltransferase family 39 protein [Candidatus Acidoferrales bacterium]|nr:glycosyltransferase family 39 protein [Candidatus Acidoferrales bacterium]
MSTRNVTATLIAVGILWICLFSGLSAIGLVGPDEPRYAWIARNMAETGNWTTPILYGQPWFEKPALYYWAGAIGFKLLNSQEWAARLPSALAALTAALAMGWLAWRRYGAATAWAVLLIFPSCVGVITFSRAASPDMLFAASLALALCCAARVIEFNDSQSSNEDGRGPTDRIALMFLGSWLGVATLAKGPAAILLAGGSVVLWALATRRWRTAFRMLHPLSLLSFALVALPWYVLCSLRNPVFFRTFILQHNFGRYFTPEFHHRQPFWFFAPVIVIGLLPWPVLLASVFLDGRRIWRENSYGNSLGFFVACWAIFPLLFFSFSQSMLPGYVLPAIAPLALLMGRSFMRASEQAHRVARWLSVGTGALWFAVCASGSHWLHRLPDTALGHAEARQLTLHFLIAGIVAGTAMIALGAFRKPVAALIVSSLFVAELTLFANRVVLPKIDPYISAKALARIVPHPLPTSPRGVPLIGVNRNCEYGVRFYRPDLEFTDWTAQTAPVSASSFSGYALVGQEGKSWLSQVQSEDRHFVRGFSSGCWIEFLLPSNLSSNKR